MAVPTLPLTTTVVPNFSISEGLPSGPTTSRMESPAFSMLSSMVVLPMACTTMVTVPALGSASAMVSGMRSPQSSSRTMTNCPGRCLRAIRGALITNSLIPRANGRASTISNTIPSTLDSAGVCTLSLWHTSHTRRSSMDRAPLDIRRRRLAVDGVPENVEHSRESSPADRRLQRPASVFHRDAADETLGGGQRDSTHAMRVELSQHLNGNLPVLRVQQRIDGRQMCIEPYIDDTAAHRDHREG